MSRRSAGFSLIELMIVLVVIAILAAIAYPSYLKSTRKSNRTDATTLMMSEAQMLERCYSQYFAYSVGGAAATCTTSPVASTTSNNGYYTVTVELNKQDPVNTTQTDAYLIKAVPVAGLTQANDKSCATFYLTNNGTQYAMDSGGTLNTQTCWGS
jgi:type IV pilus assembly protein PilE